jgi:hypothetical protein
MLASLGSFVNIAGDNKAYRNEHYLIKEGSEEMTAVHGPGRALEEAHITSRQDTSMPSRP